MKPGELKMLTAGELIERFREVSARHGRLLNARNTRAANKEYDLAAALRAELRARGAEVQEPILRLLTDPEQGTRYWAATAALGFAPDEAARTLSALSAPPLSLMGLSASMTLEEWKSGTLKVE
ncbi:DUF2019 domain-containing protein [Pyxidicoccus fallax]|uniref:DUF2019 domain-containing protein n=1 Tax=Pyxidicoccus fallax TaxID=394095 RepID=A0A848LCW9_9BACT|nr:DUF2019 domain-containing protein [Pyxidicoccus fallax]NMO14603.1 DUF2019 domain-containing protein [Pyxidicoccus fallax]NPC77367.1 DUF2019 domain-containing protein [Pyxidicoccus fallax]